MKVFLLLISLLFPMTFWEQRPFLMMYGDTKVEEKQLHCMMLENCCYDFFEMAMLNTTIISTVNGKTLMIQHDTTSPRPYSRIHLVQGIGAWRDYKPLPVIDMDKVLHG